MTSSFIKIFRFKKPKEVDDLRLGKRGEDPIRKSPVPTWRSSKDAIYIGGTSWSRPSAPYSVITAPKKEKSTRSCPGGVASSFRPSFKDVPRLSSVSQVHGSGTQGLTNDGKHSDSGVKTSEYGSCEPSPTNASNGATCVVPDSDYDNDFVAHQQCRCELRKLKRRMKEDRHRYREQLIAAQNEVEHMRHIAEKLGRSLALAQRAVDSERHKNQNLRRRLRESESAVAELRNELRVAQRDVGEHRCCDCCTSANDSSAMGAGEALCPLSQSSANFFELDMCAPLSDDLPDEVRNFRVAHCDTPSVAETPRSSTPAFELGDGGEKLADFILGTETIEDCDSEIPKGPYSPLRRSHSDSELQAVLSAMNAREIPRRLISPGVALPSDTFDEADGYGGNTEKPTNLSSDEDFAALELIGKQLKRRGDVVRFIPPRRTLREATYRQFGQKERNALAEFDYLFDLSTDASAIASSPDYPQPKPCQGFRCQDL